MTHQVLARKWRPRTFADVSGQQHIVLALMNALTQQRLHHAYLLTGTRGVGKTTLARILAKSLNCLTGITAQPCLTCAHCVAIEQGLFIDLLEIDAASRTRVEDTRELLDNVQYMPTIGRYKIYLIDEVHMLSNHSFNALLKTLEEPPAHVIFILATTDPERLPATVLSRCLQFQLKMMTVEQITARLTYILQQENYAFNPIALTNIAHAAQGSMRDALSLLDQVIAVGQGEVNEEATLTLLGGLSTKSILQLLVALSQQQGLEILTLIQGWLETGVDFHAALDQVLEQLHHISVLQTVANAPIPTSELATHLAQQFSKEQTQLYYQIALHGKRDLAYTPTPRLGFEMTLLRMLAFSPMQSIATPTNLQNNAAILTPAAAVPVAPAVPVVPAVQPIIATPTATQPTQPDSTKVNWAKLIPELGLTGLPKVLAEYTKLLTFDGENIVLELDGNQKAMLTAASQEKLSQALMNYYGKTICVNIQIGQPGLACPANLAQQQASANLQTAEQTLSNDASLQSLLQRFNGLIEPGSVRLKSLEETNK